MTPDLLSALQRCWGLLPDRPVVDTGGSTNLTLRFTDGRRALLARVYRPSVTEQRLALLQRMRRTLDITGVPVAVPLAAVDGAEWLRMGDRLVEVEPFVESDGQMNTLERLLAALPVLGRMHSVLRTVAYEQSAVALPFVNAVDAEGVVAAVRRGTDRIRRWGPTAAERTVADEADALAVDVSRLPLPTQRQLVHGDFWDNNVLFAGSQPHPCLITDFDFAGERPRIDDLALTLFFTSQDIVDVGPELLDRLVDAYAVHLDPALSDGELTALPAAMARQALWSIAIWVAQLDDVDSVRARVGANRATLLWARRILDAG